MSNFDGFKEKTKDAFESFVDFSQDTCKKAEGAAKTFGRRVKLTTEITKERTTIRRNHINIGAKYYNLFKDSPDDSFKENCEKITESLERIADMEAELENLGK